MMRRKRARRVGVRTQFDEKMLAAIDMFARLQNYEGTPTEIRHQAIRTMIRERLVKEGLIHYPEPKTLTEQLPDDDEGIDFGRRGS